MRPLARSWALVSRLAALVWKRGRERERDEEREKRDRERESKREREKYVTQIYDTYINVSCQAKSLPKLSMFDS